MTIKGLEKPVVAPKRADSLEQSQDKLKSQLPDVRLPISKPMGYTYGMIQRLEVRTYRYSRPSISGMRFVSNPI